MNFNRNCHKSILIHNFPGGSGNVVKAVGWSWQLPHSLTTEIKCPDGHLVIRTPVYFTTNPTHSTGELRRQRQLSPSQHSDSPIKIQTTSHFNLSCVPPSRFGSFLGHFAGGVRKLYHTLRESNDHRPRGWCHLANPNILHFRAAGITEVIYPQSVFPLIN